jgi:filamentous hemagglutinin family protein
MKSPKISAINNYLALCILTGISLLNISPLNAQISSDNTTGTSVNLQQNQFNITGGIEVNNNLFHSFEQFGLNSNQIANFLANPNLNNILGRITGGNASYIDGIIQITGGNPNLYLMNPAGIIFGNNTILNVPADFTATTATGILFGNEYFNGIGDNNYSNLIGNPTGFVFNTENPGAVINTGNLSVNEGNNLSLIGGTVINTGNLTASNGNINIVAVPESSKVILSQPGQILSLEINIPTDKLGNNLNISPLDLPALLTGSQDIIETQGVALNSSGNVSLTSSNIDVNAGDIALTQNINSDNLYVNATGSLLIGESELTTTNNLNLLAQDTVYIRDSETNPVLIRSGKDLYIQGNQGIDILALNHLENTPFVSGGNLTLVSDGLISGDAHFTSGGNISFLNSAGLGGDFYSFYDPIITAIGNVTFGNYTGSSLKVEATGSITAGNIIINGIDPLIDPNNYILILRAGVPVSSNTIPTDAPSDLTTSTPATAPSTVTVGDIDVGKIDFFGNGNYSYEGGIVSISATGDIKTGNINTFNDYSSNADYPSYNGLKRGDVVITSTGGNISTEDINTSNSISTGGSGNIARAGDITIKTTQGSIITGHINTSGNLFANNSSGTFSAQGGNVTLTAGNTPPENNITFKSINTSANTDSFNFTFSPTLSAIAGDVIITANSGTVRGTDFISLNSNSNTTTPSTITINTTAITTKTIFDGTYSTSNSSILSGGAVTITHDGGRNNNNFIIGDASINGTRGAIITGEPPLSSGSFPVAPNGDTVTPSTGITIISVNTPPTITPNSSSITTLTNNLQNFNLNSLLLNTNDINVDNLTYTLEVVNGSLIINGITYEAGAIIPNISITDQIQYQPPANLFGEFVAFKLFANDIVSNSNIIEIKYVQSANVDPTVLTPKLQTPTQPPQVAQGNLIPTASIDQAQTKLTEIEEATGVKPAIIYVTFSPSLTANNPITQTNTPVVALKQNDKTDKLVNDANVLENSDPDINTRSLNNRFNTIETVNSRDFQNYLNIPETPNDFNLKPQFQDSDELELILVVPGKTPIRKRIAGVTRRDVIAMGQQFQASVTSYRRPRNFLNSSQQLYQWFIDPLEADLIREEIKNLAFIMDPGIRSLPLAALHDGNQYLIENYSVGLMPTFSLTDTRYVDVKNLQVLAMGAQTFAEQDELPSVPAELSIISELWGGESFLNEDFTESNLRKARANNPYGIVHLATHGEFLPGEVSNSYIQFSDGKLTLDQFRTLGLNNPSVELMVLSACKTALGDENAELGFAGLALQAGVKTALGSLWYVSDEGTLALMSNFYRELRQAPIKAEALRQAQLAMIRGEVRLENGELTGSGLRAGINTSRNDFDHDFTHPYYWSGFTMIGNPW